MTGMSMPQQTWYGAAAGYLGMWMAMMVPMMLPSLVRMLSRYRRSVSGVDGIHLHGLTALVGAGYYVVWIVLGAAAYAAGAGLMAVETWWAAIAPWLPVATGIVLVVAGGVQLTSWKARQLALCREGSGCDRPPAPNAPAAWRHGLGLGVRCSLCCSSLMLALLAVGMMDLVAVAAVTLAISAERLMPVPLRIARVAGLAIVVLGVVTIARI
jgi:predicted metal-binding membrane protein